MRLLITCTLFAVTQLAYGLDTTTTVETQLESQASLATGYELRDSVHQAWSLVKQGELERALDQANKTLIAFDRLFDSDRKQFAFQSDDDYRAYIKNNGQEFQRVDWSYREALHIKAFIYSGARNFFEAMRIIEKIEAIAPLSAGTAVEKGYVLAQLGKNTQAYAAYRRAYELASNYNSQSGYKAAALRGMGFVLIEQNLLGEAEQFFRQSLQLEPGNRTALNELEYIDHLRDSQ